MKLPHLLFLAAFAASVAQVPDSAAPDSAATLRYIHASWNSLTRSAADCQSLADIKVAGAADAMTAPALYLPADIPMPKEVTALQRNCGVRVLRLPRVIEKLGDVHPEELPAQGLLYLPNPYVVPGDRFNEMYGWESFLLFLDWKQNAKKC
jgi:alpha,alpha-trehalase